LQFDVFIHQFPQQKPILHKVIDMGSRGGFDSVQHDPSFVLRCVEMTEFFWGFIIIPQSALLDKWEPRVFAAAAYNRAKTGQHYHESKTERMVAA
jgi:hypothetical protein